MADHQLDRTQDNDVVGEHPVGDVTEEVTHAPAEGPHGRRLAGLVRGGNGGKDDKRGQDGIENALGRGLARRGGGQVVGAFHG